MEALCLHTDNFCVCGQDLIYSEFTAPEHAAHTDWSHTVSLYIQLPKRNEGNDGWKHLGPVYLK